MEPTAVSQAIGAPIALLAFSGALLGSLLGTLGFQWAASMGWLPF